MKPYETVEELLDDSKIHGPYVIDKRIGYYFLITSIFTLYQIVLDSDREYSITSDELIIYYTWQDGSPCGKMKIKEC